MSLAHYCGYSAARERSSRRTHRRCGEIRWTNALRRCLCVASLILGVPLSAFATIPASERQALINLYMATGGPNWANSTKWTTSPGVINAVGTECSWAGITCDVHQEHVIEISLGANNLIGSLSALDQFTSLEQFNVSINQITGVIPSLSGLEYLQTFMADNNRLTGSIPTLAGTKMQTFSASVNLLSGSLPSLAGLSTLQQFDVHRNELSGPFPAISGLTSLTTFDISQNYIAGSIPPLTALPKLQVFDVSFTELTGSLPSLSALTSLTTFNASSNRFTGSIPSLAGLINLATFNVASNDLSGLIPSLSGLGNLRDFEASQNQLIGDIPVLAGLDNLQFFGVHDNHLTGTVPDLQGLTALLSFDADDNLLSGALPSLAGLPTLQVFSVRANQLTGSIPSFDGPAAQVLSFDVSFNQLTGSIPSLSGAEEFSGFFVNNNNLTGTVPIAPTFEFSVLSSFQVASLCPNSLTPSANAAWDSATQITPWYQQCEFPPPNENPGFVSISPARLLDTRVDQNTSDQRYMGMGSLVGGGTLDLTILGRGGDPAAIPANGVSAVVLNVTVTNPTEAGYVTVWPSGGVRPNASNLNFTPGETIANLVIARVGANGQVSLFNNAGSTDLIADAVGYFTNTSTLTALNPARILDTRAGYATVDGQFEGIGAISGGNQLVLTLAGRGGLPATGVGAVVMNVTATNPTASGYVTVWPSNQVRPLASNINFVRGQTIPNLVISSVSPNGQVSLFNSAGNTDLIADVLGWFPTVSELAPLTPARLLDTRTGSETIDGQFAGTGALLAASYLNLTVVGRGGVPSSGVGAVVLNLTATNPTAAGFLSACVIGSFCNDSSTLNFSPGETIANLVIAKVDSSGQVPLYNSAGSTDIVADVVGWFPTTP